VQRFRGGLVFKTHRLLYHSTLGGGEQGQPFHLDGKFKSDAGKTVMHLERFEQLSQEGHLNPELLEDDWCPSASAADLALTVLYVASTVLSVAVTVLYVPHSLDAGKTVMHLESFEQLSEEGHLNPELLEDDW